MGDTDSCFSFSQINPSPLSACQNTIKTIYELMIIAIAFTAISRITLPSLIDNHQKPVNQKSKIINQKSKIINHQSSIINHQSSIINHQTSNIKHQSSKKYLGKV
jgi:homospermidine synthase